MLLLLIWSGCCEHSDVLCFNTGQQAVTMSSSIVWTLHSMLLYQ